MRINKMNLTKEALIVCQIISTTPVRASKEMYRDRSGEFVCRYGGLISITCYFLKILSISTGIFIIWNSY